MAAALCAVISVASWAGGRPLVAHHRASVHNSDVKSSDQKLTSGITVIPEVSDTLRAEATGWPVWDSEKHPQSPAGSGRFRYKYSNEERILILTGSATLIPEDGTSPVTLGAGEFVTFSAGFSW